jgi:hypothetical protein
MEAARPRTTAYAWRRSRSQRARRSTRPEAIEKTNAIAIHRSYVAAVTVYGMNYWPPGHPARSSQRDPVHHESDITYRNKRSTPRCRDPSAIDDMTTSAGALRPSEIRRPTSCSDHVGPILQDTNTRCGASRPSSRPWSHLTAHTSVRSDSRRAQGPGGLHRGRGRGVETSQRGRSQGWEEACCYGGRGQDSSAKGEAKAKAEAEANAK